MYTLLGILFILVGIAMFLGIAFWVGEVPTQNGPQASYWLPIICMLMGVGIIYLANKP